LTDSSTRENYQFYGHPDGEQPTTIGIALPSTVNQGKWSTILLYGYITFFAIVVPGGVTIWWFNILKTNEGLDEKTAYRFFASATHRKEMDFGEIISFISETQEIVQVIKKERLDFANVKELYKGLVDIKQNELSAQNPVILLQLLY